jgi:hypothetical protein
MQYSRAIEVYIYDEGLPLRYGEHHSGTGIRVAWCSSAHLPHTTTGPFRFPAATTGPAGTFLLAVGPGSLLTAATW